MQVSAGKDGIQRLLAAEKEAQQTVANARKAKTERLKQAKAEAEKEIKAYKQQREDAYQKRIAEDSTSTGANSSRLESESKEAIRAIQKSIAAKKQEVADQLLKYVTSVSLK